MQRFKNATEAFEILFGEIESEGVAWQNTRAIFNKGFYLDNPLDNLIRTPIRNWSLSYAKREWEWYESGDPSALEISKHAPIWKKHLDEQGKVNSNYGYQWNRELQLGRIISMLRNDKDTRQAWLTIYDGKEWRKYRKDTPCTLNVGFHIERGKLCMTVLMRSNDLWFGFCNDQYCFSRLQQKVASELGFPVGHYFHYAHNLHLYNKLP